MTIKEKIMKYSLLLLLMIGMNFSIVYGALYAVRPDQNLHVIIWVIAGLTILCMMLGTNKHSLIISMLILLIGGVVITTYLYYEGTLTTVLLKINFIIRRNKELLSISILTIAITYVSTLKYFRLLIPIAIGSSIYILYIVQGMPLPNFSLEFFIGISLCYYFYDYYMKMEKVLEVPIKSKDYMKSTGVFIVIILSLTWLSASIVPLKFSSLHSVLDSNAYKENGYSYSEYYPYTGRLGGDLIQNESEVLGIVAKAPTYLRAGTKSIYTGYSWKNPKTESETFFAKDIKFIDTYEAIQGLSLLTDQPFSQVFNEEALRIMFKDIRTKSLFIPPKSMNVIVSRNSYSIYSENEDTLFLEIPYGKGFVYVVQCYTPKYENEIFKEALRKSEKGLYSKAKKQGIDPFEGEIDQFIERASEIQNRYTQLPKRVAERVRTLATSITKDDTTTYDKVKAIETYLSESYTYTLAPGRTNPTKDFVEQFLFETKEGYCTYFASAMAVLTRCLGIPSRYVEGYKMPTSAHTGTSTYTVTGKEAHAWVEVYFEGAGWIMFEPTASYAPNLVYEMQDPGKEVIASQNEIMIEIGDIPPTGKGFNEGQIGIGVGFLLVGVLFIGGYTYKTNKIRSMKPKEATLYFYHLCLRELAKKHQVIEAGETELAYAQRIDGTLSLDSISFEEVTYIYLKAQYSLLSITREEQEKIQACYKILKKRKVLSFDGL